MSDKYSDLKLTGRIIGELEDRIADAEKRGYELIKRGDYINGYSLKIYYAVMRYRKEQGA